jgi:hypothetical protein
MLEMDFSHWVVLIIFVAIIVLFAVNCSIHKDSDKET